MKILFFSDIHGSPDSLSLLDKHIQDLAPDCLAILGDLLYHGPRNPLKSDYEPPKTAAYLNLYKKKIIAVRGNCDSEVDQMMLDFPMMSDYSIILAGNLKFFLTHGHLWNPDKLPPLEPPAVFVYGHTHLFQLERLESGIIALNPGSVSLPKGGNPPSFAFSDGNSLKILKLDDGSELKSLELF